MENKALKVLFYNDFKEKIGGTEIYQQLMVEGLSHFGQEVDQLFGTSRPFPTSNFYFKMWMLASASRWVPSIGNSLKRKILDFQPDVVHLNNNKLYTFTVLKTCSDLKVPVISSFHDFHFLTTESGDPFGIKKRWKENLRDILRSYSSAFLSHTKIVAKSLEEFKMGPVSYIPLFYDERLWCLPESDFPHRKQHILYFGRIEEEKGIFDLLAAFERIKPSYPELKLNYYGSGTAMENLQKAISKSAFSKDIKYHGKLNQTALNAVCQQSLLLVVPTKIEEPFGLTGIEGQAAGLITIGADNGGIPVWCIHEKTGLLFEAANVDDLCSKIERVLNEELLRQKLSKGAQENLGKNFDRLTNIEKTLSLYRGLSFVV